MLAVSSHNRPSKKHDNFRIECLKISNFLKSDFSYLALGKARDLRCLKVSDFFKKSILMCLELGKAHRVGSLKTFDFLEIRLFVFDIREDWES